MLEKYQHQSLEAVLFALTVGGLSQRKVVNWVQRFLGSTLSVASIGAVLRQAQQQVQQRRQQPLPAGRYRALAVDGVYHRYRHTGQRGGRPGVLLVAVGVREGGAFDVLDWLDGAEETAEAYEQLFTRLWQRGLERVELLISDGAPAILSAAAVVYPGAAHQLCLVHWFRNLVTPRLRWGHRRKLRREFWWIWEADNEAQARQRARRFCQRWRFWAPEMVEKFWSELPPVLAFFRFPAPWRHRLRTTNLAEGFFKHVRKYLSRFPGCMDSAHSEHVLGCFLLAAEATHG
jgi:transposase-like protein